MRSYFSLQIGTVRNEQRTAENIGCSSLTGPHALGPKCVNIGHKILTKQPHDCSY